MRAARSQLLFGFAKKRKRRKGGGRKPKNGVKAGVAHLRRAGVTARWPLLVTVRMRGETWGMRSGRCFRVLKRAFQAARVRFGMRLCHFAVLGNHIHFLVEAENGVALARGMKGLGVRMAKALNRVMGRSGAVYADRYHLRVCRTPTETAHAMSYVRLNAQKHGFIRSGLDPFSSWVVRDAVAAPGSWLLDTGWRRAGPRHPPS